MVAVDRNAVVHVVYVVPLNEGRGVYHTCSGDGGESWSEPTTIADGVDTFADAVLQHDALARVISYEILKSVVKFAEEWDPDA